MHKYSPLKTVEANNQPTLLYFREIQYSIYSNRSCILQYYYDNYYLHFTFCIILNLIIENTTK